MVNYREPQGPKTKMVLMIDENLRVEAGKQIDGIRYLTLAHIINLALSEWLERENRLNKRKNKAPTAGTP